MGFLRTRRLATWRTHYRGLKPPDRPGGGVLILDRNPRAGDHRLWAAWFLPVLTCGSCCFAVLLIVSIFEHPSPATLGSSALTLGMSLLLSSATVRAFFSREQLILDGPGLDYIWTNGLMRKSRRLPFQEIRRLTRYSVMDGGNENQPSHPEYGLAIETIGQTLCVGQSHDRVEVDQLRENVEWHLQDRYAAWVNEPECADCEVLDSSGFRPEPPFDSSLSCRREWDRTEFVRRIREERPAVLVSLSYVLVFIGLLSQPLLSSTPSVLSAFLTLLLIAGLIGLSTMARRYWVVRPGEITTSVRVGGLGWSRTTDIEWLEQMELRRLPSKTPWKSSFELALVDLDGEDKAVFGPLTEGEARWMAGIVADVLKDALPKSGQQVYRWSVTTDAPTAGSQAMADAWLDEGLTKPGSKGSARGKSR